IDRLGRRLADDADADAVAKRRASDDPAVTAASDVAADLVYLGGLEDPEVAGAGPRLILATGVALALDHGPTASSGFLFAAFGSVLASLGDHAEARASAGVALALLDALPASRYRASARA